jgi:streptogramin lyase
MEIWYSAPVIPIQNVSSITDQQYHTVSKIDTSGILTIIAGTGIGGFNELAGVATSINLYTPMAIVIDASGTLYFTDSNNHIIRKLYKDSLNVWQIETLAGGDGGNGAGNADGYGLSALFYGPKGLTLDTSGNLFIMDTFNNSIRKLVISTGQVSTVVKSSPQVNFLFNGNFGSITSDNSRYLYFTDFGNNCIWKFDLITRVCVIFSGALGAGYIDAPASSARFYGPLGITYFYNRLYISDLYNQAIRKIDINIDSAADWVEILPFNNTNSSTPSLISGTIPPNNSIGNQVQGQYYINTTTKYLYQYVSNTASLVSTPYQGPTNTIAYPSGITSKRNPISSALLTGVLGLMIDDGEAILLVIEVSF